MGDLPEAFEQDANKHSLTRGTGGWAENLRRLKATVRRGQEKPRRIKYERRL